MLLVNPVYLVFLSFIWELLSLELEWMLNGCDSWNHTLPSPEQAQRADRMHDMEDSLRSLCLAGHSD